MYGAVGIPEGDPSAPLRCGRDDGTKGLSFFELTAAHYSCILYNNSIFKFLASSRPCACPTAAGGVK
jgi:hypothetical protein